MKRVIMTSLLIFAVIAMLLLNNFYRVPKLSGSIKNIKALPVEGYELWEQWIKEGQEKSLDLKKLGPLQEFVVEFRVTNLKNVKTYYVIVPEKNPKLVGYLGVNSEYEVYVDEKGTFEERVLILVRGEKATEEWVGKTVHFKICGISDYPASNFGQAFLDGKSKFMKFVNAQWYGVCVSDIR